MRGLISKTATSVVVERRPHCQIRYTGLALPLLPAFMRDLAQAALVDLAFYWRERHGPHHFTVHAYEDYGGREPYVYKERAGVPGFMLEKRYQDRYGAVRAHESFGGRVRPLYRSGALRQAFLHGNMEAKPAGAGAGVQVKAIFHGLPRYTYYFDPSQRGGPRNRMHPLQHNKVEELSIMSETELEDLRKQYEKLIGTMLAGGGAGAAEAAA
jgi:hypothetical protein